VTVQEGEGRERERERERDMNKWIGVYLDGCKDELVHRWIGV
jgi:hypothetical protein